MSEQIENKSVVEEIPPFKPGDLVILRNKDKKLKSFQHYKPDDIGLVLSLEKAEYGRWRGTKYTRAYKWDVIVMWQQSKQKWYNHGLTDDCSKLWHTRLKKIS